MYRLIKDNVERVVNDNHTRDILINEGYELVREAQTPIEVNLNQLTVEELKELAKEKDIEGVSKMKKDELIEVLEGSE